MPDDLGPLYVWDNVPEFVARVIKSGRMIYSDKIIVGKPSTPTPMFSARMQSIVFNPEWAVPESIKVNELLPRLRSDPTLFGGGDTSVLREHNLRVVFNGNTVDPSQVDWAHADIRRFDFFQPPGPKNVLGTLKFRFPNKYDVYMHDTPERELFARPSRAMSHGCMRVHEPARLAEVLLNEDKGWSSNEISNRLATGNNTEVNLSRAIPVHITYLTAVAHDDGRVDYFRDIYGYDGMMADALEGRPVRRPLVRDEDVAEEEPQHKTDGPLGGLNDFFSVLLGF
jgi:L,D-transpeptidase YcbB